MSETAGRIFEIQRFSIHDGPGIRTTVFLQGCPLSCLWCHNPEGRPSHSLISFQPDKCVSCGQCFSTCAEHAHRMEGDTHILDRDRCRICGNCVAGCHAQALEKVGREAGVVTVMEEVLQDRPFYSLSGGGMTLSGGEPLCQIDFAVALLEAASAADIGCAVETSGAVPFSHFAQVLPFVDLFLYDIKETDPERHRRFTGVPNDRILANLLKLHAAGARIRLRLPLIPGYNDRPEHFLAVVDLVRSLSGLEGVEIMPYHHLGASKAARFGMQAGLDLTPPSAATVDGWIEAFSKLGVQVVNRRISPAADEKGAGNGHLN